METPTEVVTAENVDDYVSRQTDNQVQYDYYQEYMAENFADLEAVARPYDDLRTPGNASRNSGAVANQLSSPAWTRVRAGLHQTRASP